MQLQECSSKTFVPSYNWDTKTVNHSLFSGRKYVLISACFFPVLSAIAPQVSFACNIALSICAIVSIFAGCLFGSEAMKCQEKETMANRIVAYCYAVVPGSALSLEVGQLVNPLAGVIAGIATSMFFSRVVLDAIEKTNSNTP